MRRTILLVLVALGVAGATATAIVNHSDERDCSTMCPMGKARAASVSSNETGKGYHGCAAKKAKLAAESGESGGGHHGCWK
jgi:hypothetical protein